MNSTEVWWRSSLFKDIANDSSGFHETFKMMLLEWKQLVDNQKFMNFLFYRNRKTKGIEKLPLSIGFQE